jgi:hypothetical protein
MLNYSIEEVEMAILNKMLILRLKVKDQPYFSFRQILVELSVTILQFLGRTQLLNSANQIIMLLNLTQRTFISQQIKM